MKFRSLILSTLLALLVAFTAQGAAVARTMPDATGQMVLCTGSGPVMVFVDETGAPTAPPQLCPDYAVSLIAALDILVLDLVPLGIWHPLDIAPMHFACRVLSFGTPNARAPPVIV